MTGPLLDFRNITVMRGDKAVLRHFSLEIGTSENVAIIGPNGSGKSTLIKVISRELYPLANDGSEVRLLGQQKWNVFDLRALLGIVSNDLMATCTRDVTGRELVLSGFFSSVVIYEYHHVTPAMEKKADEILERLEITHLADRWLDELSSGEARRVLIGRALVHDPKALLLDEPTNSLDLHAIHELRTIVRKLAQEGTSVLMVTHHLPDIVPEIERVILIKDGKVFRDGRKQEILRSETLSELFNIPVEVLERDGYYHLL